MKKIIKGKLYDTETAEEIGYYCNTSNTRNLNFYEETLYRTKKGQFFLEYNGNANSKYAIWVDNEGNASSGIRLLNEDQVRNWIGMYCDVEKYIYVFGSVEEG